MDPSNGWSLAQPEHRAWAGDRREQRGAELSFQRGVVGWQLQWSCVAWARPDNVISELLAVQWHWDTGDYMRGQLEGQEQELAWA